MNQQCKRAQTVTFILFGIILAFTIGNIFYYKLVLNTDQELKTQLTRLVLSFGIMYLIYIGKHWAKMLFSVLLVVGIVISIIGVFTNSGGYISSIIFLLVAMVYAYTIYYMNANDDFDAFIRHQREYSDRT